MDTLLQPAVTAQPPLLELFADVLDYPGPVAAAALRRSAGMLAAASPVLRGLVNEFAVPASAMPPAQLEELYAATFDLQPDFTLNLTHHLFGEDHGKRSAMLIELAAAARTAGLDLGGELPDHLCWMLRLLALSPADSELQDLTPYCILPGLRSLSQRLPPDHLYQPLFHALFLLLADQPLAEQTA
ncbi:MAG: hypothetical protein ACRD0Y_12950 [Terriglobales bacterium]